LQDTKKRTIFDILMTIVYHKITPRVVIIKQSKKLSREFSRLLKYTLIFL